MQNGCNCFCLDYIHCFSVISLRHHVTFCYSVYSVSSLFPHSDIVFLPCLCMWSTIGSHHAWMRLQPVQAVWVRTSMLALDLCGNTDWSGICALRCGWIFTLEMEALAYSCFSIPHSSAAGIFWTVLVLGQTGSLGCAMNNFMCNVSCDIRNVWLCLTI